MDKKLIVANWKMYPESLAEAEGILEFINDYFESLDDKKEFSLVFCPPFVFLEDFARILRTSHLEHEASLGAQDIAIDDGGALTGEVSGSMLEKIGVRYVIVGHSERRWKLGESDEIVNHKLKSVLRNGMIPIICIGEKTRKGDFGAFLEEQVRNTFKDLSVDEVSKCIVAYEPVWAISTNLDARPDTPESATESISIIRSFLAASYSLHTAPLFLYGGSVNSRNAGDFLKEKDIAGILVGGASVNKEEFLKVLNTVVGL